MLGLVFSFTGSLLFWLLRLIELDDRGFSRIFELILALLLVFSSSLFLPSIGVVGFDRGSLEAMLYDSFVYADRSGIFVRCLWGDDWDLLVSMFSEVFPSDVVFRISVFDGNSSLIFSYDGGLLDSMDVVSVSYLLSFMGGVRVIVVEASW